MSFSQSKLTNKFLAEILKDVKKEFVNAPDDSSENIAHVWQLAVGEKIAAVTEIKSFNQGFLVIKVASASLCQLLTTTERPKILAKLKKDFPFLKVKNLVFRTG